VSVSIRRLTGRDLPAVLAIERGVFPDDAWSERMFVSELAQPETRHYIVAESDGVIAGYAGMSAVAGQADVQTIAVRPERQGQGIGAALLHNLLVTAKTRGCRDVFLDVRVGNDQARRLYLRTGFTDIGLRRGYYQPSGADAIVMHLAMPWDREPEQAGQQ
jgi:[ribosomal protein S18]-alanine N-acetyltransferase